MTSRNTRLALLGVATAAALTAAYAATRIGPPAFHGTDLGPGIEAHPFTLTAADRGPVALSDFRGKAVLLFFGYTHCPDVCPISMGKLRRAMELLGDRRRDVQVLLITVDPELDSPERLREYLQNFDLGFVGLGGSRAELEAVTRAYGVYVGAVETDAPAADAEAHAGHDAPHAGHRVPARLIAHTSHVFGIDRRGQFRLLWDYGTPAEEIADDVRRLLRL